MLVTRAGLLCTQGHPTHSLYGTCYKLISSVTRLEILLALNSMADGLQKWEDQDSTCRTWG